MMEKNTHQVSFRLPERIYNQIEQEAKADRRSIPYMVRLYLEERFGRQEPLQQEGLQH